MFHWCWILADDYWHPETGSVPHSESACQSVPSSSAGRKVHSPIEKIPGWYLRWQISTRVSQKGNQTAAANRFCHMEHSRIRPESGSVHCLISFLAYWAFLFPDFQRIGWSVWLFGSIWQESPDCRPTSRSVLTTSFYRECRFFLIFSVFSGHSQSVWFTWVALYYGSSHTKKVMAKYANHVILILDEWPDPFYCWWIFILSLKMEHHLKLF